ncbi:MAG: hypothetical protein ONB15_05435 [candidate division KSB1 bacterium]|nr:hypothetical protein [candidate division KSB1 bacterium]
MKLSGFVNSWTTKRWLYLAILLPIFVIAPGLAYYLDSKNLANIIYWLTGLVVLLYTIETQGMRQEMVRQNEIVIQPLVIAVIGGPEGCRQLILRNIGRGPALSIHVEDVTLTDAAGDNVPFIMKVQTMDYLEPQTERAPITELVSACSAIPGSYFDAIPSLDPGTAVDSCKLTIKYDDIDGQLRYSLMQMGKDGIRLLDHGKA